MFKINQYVYLVNDIGILSKQPYRIKSVNKSLIILDASFIGKTGKLRNFEHHIETYLADKKLFYDKENAYEVANERKFALQNKIIKYSIGDTISWNKGKYKGIISEIKNDCYIVKLPMRHWSLYVFNLDIQKAI